MKINDNVNIFMINGLALILLYAYGIFQTKFMFHVLIGFTVSQIFIGSMFLMAGPAVWIERGWYSNISLITKMIITLQVSTLYIYFAGNLFVACGLLYHGVVINCLSDYSSKVVKNEN